MESADKSIERKTYSPYLQAQDWRRPQVSDSNTYRTPTGSPTGFPTVSPPEEGWGDRSEQLLYMWSLRWDAKNAAHGKAEGKKRWGHLCLQFPTVLIPIIMAPLLSMQYVDEQTPLVALCLVTSGLTGALQSILQWERKSEQHAQAAFRYADLLSDAEEVLCKDRIHRPKMDVTIQRFKMRMDSAERYSPSVSIPSHLSEDKSEDT